MLSRKRKFVVVPPRRSLPFAADDALDVGHDRVTLAPLTVIRHDAVGSRVDIPRPSRIGNGVEVDETLSCCLE